VPRAQDRRHGGHGVEEALLGSVLRRLRIRAGLSQEALAERAGVSASAVGALEQGQRRRPHPRTLVALADAMQLTLEDRRTLLEAAREPYFEDGALEAPATTGPEGETLAAAASPSSTEAGLPAGGTPLTVAVEAPAASRPRLPRPTTPLFGRDDDIARVRALLEPSADQARLLTLLGPGGVGKTRLALAVADRLQTAFRDGVVFVDLAPLRDHRVVPATIARALNVREQGGRSARELLLEYLADRQLLLVLDNFEHLVEAAPVVAEFCAHCPQLAQLITSRVALRIRVERRFTVPPLATPGPDSGSIDAIAQSAAVQLFVERAQVVDSHVALDHTTAQPIAAICRRLDGTPLAIELAAARAGLLRPDALLRRLEQRLPVLANGSLDLPERQHTLHNSLAWSYDLLGPQEQTLFRRLAAFTGRWSLAAAEAVCSDAIVGRELVLDLVGNLVDSSMVYVSAPIRLEPQFALLETVREFAERRLADDSEAHETRRRHAAYYLELVERAAIEMHGPDQEAWIRRLEEANDNVRAALDWLMAHAEQAQALRFATAATWCWLRNSYFTDARRIIELVKTADARVDARVLAHALLAAARFASTQTDYAAQAAYDQKSLGLFQSLGDAAGYAEAVTDLGAAEWQQGQMERARIHLQDGLARCRALGDRVGIATALLPLANLSRDTGDFEAAQRLYAECLALRQASGDALGVAHVLNNSAWLGLYMGDMALARRAEQALDIRRKLGARLETGVSQTLLARIALAANDSASAEALFLDSLAVHREVGNRWGVALALEGLAELLVGRQPKLALQFAGAAGSLRSAINRPLPPVEEPLFHATLRAAQAAVGSNEAGTALLSGASLSMADAVSLALELRGSASPGLVDARLPPRGRHLV
jgi:predicted ATPase/transcriptional regulator with XRE-family HTH domain